MLISSMCLSSPLKAKQEAKSEHVKEINIMTQTMVTQEAHAENIRGAFMKLQREYQKLHSDYEAAMAVVDDVEAKLEAAAEKDEDDDYLQIRQETRGKAVGFRFVRHCATLLATGGSARSVREQLLLNALFFLGKDAYDIFLTQLPSLRWFQYQREGMGLESLVYSLIRIAKCKRVEQWGFDETSLNGVATLNQWCRIIEGEELVIITMECAGLLPGSSSAKVAEHVRLTWERGQHLVTLVRAELGEQADALVPLTNGGVVLAKLQGVMHDTCNTANAIARRVKAIRDDSGINLFGVEAWQEMEGDSVGWQDFLCGNHSRNLHFDAFNRLFTAYMKVPNKLCFPHTLFLALEFVPNLDDFP
jgi:hypothetical protein